MDLETKWAKEFWPPTVANKKNKNIACPESNATWWRTILLAVIKRRSAGISEIAFVEWAVHVAFGILNKILRSREMRSQTYKANKL